MSWFEQSARWYAVLLALTWAWAPLVRLLCGRLRDRGAAVVRPLALLGVVYPSWLLASLDLVPYSTVGLWLTAGVAALVGWGLALRRGEIDAAWLRSMLVVEGVALVAFAAAVWLRGFTPELLNTEKPMDIAFLASSARTGEMPPPDPWFAGEPINYYYLGYALHGAVTRLAGIPATVGFNLALATTFSMAVAATAGLAFDATRPWLSKRRALAAAGLAAFLLAIAGNLYAATRLLRTPGETWEAGWWDKLHGVGWRASRIVCDGEREANDCVAPAVETINEFPVFSFVLGDLHPHVTALPFTVVALALALNLFLAGRAGTSPPGEGSLAIVAVSGAVVGSLYALNSWDYPTYLLLAGAAVWFGGRGLSSRERGPLLAILVAASLLAWLPFTATFAPPTGGDVSRLPDAIQGLPVLPELLTAVGAHSGERTSAGEFLTMFGVPYVAALWLLGSGLLRADRRRAGRVPPLGVLLAVVAGAVALLAPMPLLVLCGAPLAAALALLRREGTWSARALATALFGAGFAIVLLTEVFYIRDVFGNRMNTLFKAYYQVWTLFAVATALTVVVLWREAWPRRAARPALALFVGAALLATSVYPLLSWSRWTEYWGPRDWHGLDGIAYVGRSHPDELAALRWLQEHAGEDDVIIEAAGCSFEPNSQLPYNRASAYTGVPTIVGWRGHEDQWRSGQPELREEIAARQEDVARIYAEPNGDLLARYGVTLLYVGRYEREAFGCPSAGPYPAVAEAGYPGPGWSEVFSSGEVHIYRRAGTA